MSMPDRPPTEAEWNDACQKLFDRPWQGLLVGRSREEQVFLLEALVGHFRNEPDFVFTEGDACDCDHCASCKSFNGIARGGLRKPD